MSKDFGIEAQIGVRDSVARYAITMDGRNIDECASLFAQDASIEVMGETFVGREQIRSWMEMLAENPPGIHLTTNTVVNQIDETHATAISAVGFSKRGEGGGWQIMVAGFYTDELTLVDGRWLFSKRRISLS